MNSFTPISINGTKRFVGICPSFLGVKSIMFAFLHHRKIFWVVIVPISISVMAYFVRSQKPAQCSFHDESVFKHIPLAVTEWMVGCLNGIVLVVCTVFNATNVSWGVGAAKILRTPDILTRKRTEFFTTRGIGHKFCFAVGAGTGDDMTGSPSGNKIACVRTVLSFFVVGFERLLTLLTFFYHKTILSFYTKVSEYSRHVKCFSEEYCQIARERLEAVESGVPVREARKGQMGLF